MQSKESNLEYARRIIKEKTKEALSTSVTTDNIEITLVTYRRTVKKLCKDYYHICGFVWELFYSNINNESESLKNIRYSRTITLVKTNENTNNM